MKVNNNKYIPAPCRNSEMSFKIFLYFGKSKNYIYQISNIKIFPKKSGLTMPTRANNYNKKKK